MPPADGDRPDYLDREKKSFSERDRMRREGRSGGAGRIPGGGDVQATRRQLGEAENLFGGRKQEHEKLGRALVAARGTPELTAACRAFLDGVGPPEELRHVTCFLECGEPALVLAGLAALEAACAAGTLHATPGLRTELRMLAEDPDDQVAGAAEDLLAAI